MTRLTDERIASLARQYLGTCKRVFYTKWKDGIDIEYPTLEVEQFARAIEAELSKQEPVAFVIARETAFDLPGRPRKELGYIVPAGSVSFPTQEAAHEAHREMGLPLGWVVMRLEQLVATPQQPAPDTVQVPREPTPAQCAAGRSEAMFQTDENVTVDGIIHIYRAMIAAAPKSTP